MFAKSSPTQTLKHLRHMLMAPWFSNLIIGHSLEKRHIQDIHYGIVDFRRIQDFLDALVLPSTNI